MRLISLTANKSSFHPVSFNPTGVSLIVGRQKAKGKGSGKTFNGVGKSLLMSLVHFCLGSSKNETLESAIPGWEFTLNFEINGKRHSATRGTSQQNKILFDGTELTIDKFCDALESETFRIPPHIKFLTFRTLASRFMRPRKESYVSFDSTYPEETPYLKLLRSSFLLGLNVDLIQKKRDLRMNKERINKFKENLSKDEIFTKFFTSNKNVEIELKDLDEKITSLDQDLKSFTVAENYHAIERDANNTKKRLQSMRNRTVVLENAITNIDVSLEITPEKNNQRLIKLFEETTKVMSAAVKKRVEEVVEFHEKLIGNRTKRLQADRQQLEAELSPLNSAITVLSKELDGKLQFLNSHRALDEFVALTNHRGEVGAKAQKIRDYKNLLEQYSNELREISFTLLNQTKATNEYLQENEAHFSLLLDTFRNFSKRFYPDRPGGIVVKNNEGDNQVRFDIEAHIQDDASDGINEVKLFCFDLLLLTGRFNHSVDSLFHDSRLFSDIDPRQRASLFKLAWEISTTQKLQYIATLNQDQIESMKDQFEDAEFDDVISKNVVLELTDDDEKGKLLGIEVDMQY